MNEKGGAPSMPRFVTCPDRTGFPAVASLDAEAFRVEFEPRMQSIERGAISSTMQKQSVWIIWIGSVAAMVFGSGWVATVGQWAFGLTFVAHIVEFIMNRSLFERAGGSMARHFVQTLIYGLFHWSPIKRRLESRQEE